VDGTADGSRWRLRVVATADGFSAVAVSLAETDATVRRAELVAAGSSVLVLLLAGLGGLALVRVGLRPLSAIESTAEAIADGDLTRRVPPGRAGTEVGRLSASLNTMLSQIEQAFADRAGTEERLRQFVADASHELRTPLSTIRGHAEMYRQGMVTTEVEVSRLLSRIESESLRMSALVDDLLLLARLDASRGLEHGSVDLLSVAADAALDAQAQDPRRPVVILSHTDPPWIDAAPVVQGDDARLRQVMANLLSNALRHTPPGTPVEVEIGVKPDVVVVNVVDHGPGMPPETAARVFERFYRGDAGRARSRGGSGLGLSIVASLVAAHGGSTRYAQTPGGGSTFVVTLPTQPS
jgi:two-component system, OmpR family, sensor kinase